jgi:hypothetical protein
MFVKTLKSLVLRDVSVRLDGTVASLRLGFGYLAESQPREVPFFSMRHGGGETVAESQGDRAQGYCDTSVDNPVALRAGRSVRLAGVLNRRTPTTTVVGGTTGLTWRSWQAGGAIPTAAAGAGRNRIPPHSVAPVGKTSSCASVPASRTGIPSCLSALQRLCCNKQAGRTPPASTRGQVS